MLGLKSVLSLSVALIYALLINSCQAITLGKGLVRIDDQNFNLMNKDIPLNITDTRISIGFTLTDDEKTPDLYLLPRQVSVVLSTPAIDSEIYYYPHLVENKIYELNLPVNTISKYLLSSDEISISVITGDPMDSSLNSILSAGSLNPSNKLKSDKQIELPKRFGKRDEIHHIFRSDPKNLPGFISSNFVFLVILALIVLLLAWNYFDAVNVNNLGKFNPMVSLFLASIFAFEYYFFDYYCGTSIFTSLKRFTITGIFALYFGSKTLNDMYKLRSKDLR